LLKLLDLAVPAAIPRYNPLKLLDLAVPGAIPRYNTLKLLDLAVPGAIPSQQLPQGQCHLTLRLLHCWGIIMMMLQGTGGCHCAVDPQQLSSTGFQLQQMLPPSPRQQAGHLTVPRLASLPLASTTRPLGCKPGSWAPSAFLPHHHSDLAHMQFEASGGNLSLSPVSSVLQLLHSALAYIFCCWLLHAQACSHAPS
jgi:hypothetical protein